MGLTRNGYYLYELATFAHNSVDSLSTATGKFYNRLKNTKGELLPIISGYDTLYVGGYNPWYYGSGNHLKINKSSLLCDTSYTTSNNISYGIVFGNGTDPENFDDYNMSGDLFTTYSYSYSHTSNGDENGITNTMLFTLTNTGSEAFTISEVGFYDMARCASSYPRYYRYHILTYRKLLETPITIEPGGVGQITLTFRGNMPTS